MRAGSIGILMAVAWAAPAQTPPSGMRYGIAPARDIYPQSTPQETLASIVKTIEGDRMDYLMAQLADPEYVDERVQRVHHGKFSELVDEASRKLARDPGVIKSFRRYLSEGTWDVQETKASARVKDRPAQVMFRKLGDRWFMDNRQRPPAEPKSEPKDK